MRKKETSDMDRLLITILKVLPSLTLIYSFWLVYVALNILTRAEQSCVYFLFLAFEVYVNWIAILNVSSNCSSAKDRDSRRWELKEKQDVVEVDILGYEDKNSLLHDSVMQFSKSNLSDFVNGDFVPANGYAHSVATEKIWYCPKCCLNCLPNCRHCPLCLKCILDRDHHCLFLGACISRQNMKHFIVILLYVGLVCWYIFDLICVEMNLYEDVTNDSTLIMRHFLPVSFSKWLVGRESVHNLLRIFVLNTTASIVLFSAAFEMYHLYLVLTGKLLNKIQKNKRYPSGLKNVGANFKAVFGEYGILNFIVPLGFTDVMLKKYF